jgi:hypothetical protein
MLLAQAEEAARKAEFTVRLLRFMLDNMAGSAPVLAPCAVQQVRVRIHIVP